MDPEALTCARYWRNSLADAALGKGALTDKDFRRYRKLELEEPSGRQVAEADVAALFADRDRDRVLAVVLRPLVYQSRTHHGRRRDGRPPYLSPIVTRAKLDADGRLVLGKTTVPRDLLEPLLQQDFAIGTVAALDDFLTRPPDLTLVGAAGGSSGVDWSAYRAHCARLEAAVFPNLAADRDFQRLPGAFLIDEDGGDASARIIALYDHIARDAPDARLFSTFAAQRQTSPEPCLPPDAGFAARLAHPSDAYALADAQRTALTHVLASEPGEVVAVNGPPGTGKTTLLLSVVASLWAKAALDAGEPPIIMASSNNNQAVTNILDAFGEGFVVGQGAFAGRWLPGVTSFGSFFPSKTQEAPASASRLTPAFFVQVEDADYIERARAVFLEKAQAAFQSPPNLDLEAALGALHARLVDQALALDKIERAWRERVRTRAEVVARLGLDPAPAMAKLRRQVDVRAEAAERAEALAAKWDRHRGGESLLVVLLAWLAPVAARRLARARTALSVDWPGALPDWARIQEVTPAVVRLVATARSARLAAMGDLEAAEAAQVADAAALEGWKTALIPLEIEPEAAAAMSLDDCDKAADVHLRLAIFQTATHYWEGRWLLDAAAIGDPTAEQKRNGRAAVVPRWRRRMKLTPCGVATFYLLPELMMVRRHERGGFSAEYLYEVIDLLIVDEAGQVTPEVAGASFALAKRALVIGDTAQIEPIWQLPASLDKANLLDAGIVTMKDLQTEKHAFIENGRAVSSGSVMRVAQYVSRYHQEVELARGLMLYEHRRCFDEIIGYCNDLCYAGKLQPMRGPKAQADGPPRDGRPAMGHLHIDGLCERPAAGSRRNLVEAQTIAAWIANHADELTTAYPGLSLAQVVGVITPFRAQKQAIQVALKALSIDVASSAAPTFGTVHTFQGAERPIIIFSGTYSKHDDGEFIDSHSSLLNVAVSRAKDSFLLFGDMDCLSAARPNSPRGRLCTRLLAQPENALTFEPIARPDLADGSTIEHLRNASEHDAFLIRVLRSARREVQIVTPWVTWRALEQSRLLPAIKAAVASGLALTVYTDRKLNADRARRSQEAADALDMGLAALRQAGVRLIEVCDVHSKILMADEDLYCVGSFNWLSGARDGRYARHETSLAYVGKAAATEIDNMKASMDKRTSR